MNIQSVSYTAHNVQPLQFYANHGQVVDVTYHPIDELERTDTIMPFVKDEYLNRIYDAGHLVNDVAHRMIDWGVMQ